MRFFFLLIICSLLAACGFHLRGNTVIPPQIHRITILSNANYSQFQQKLQQQLRIAGAQLVENPQQADLVLLIISEQIHKTFESVSTNVQVHQYTLQYVVQYQLENAQQIAITPPINIVASRVYRENANQELGSNIEETVLVGEMQQEVIRNLLARLAARDTIIALRHHENNE